ncbi:MAG: HEAT repeat domain-containing protein [Planctomycetota bacterium]|nr:HEAT repeat domain-containing protein [Planctomycetota bacterium]
MRCLAIMAVGMLGDQLRDGPLLPGVAENYALWRRLTKEDHGAEINIAYLTALGMQPSSGAGEAVLEGLRDIAIGKRVAKRTWNARERSHALCTLVRLGGPAWRPILLRVMADPRLDTDVRRAAFITLGERAEDYDAEDRRDLVRSWDAALKASKDPLTRGLGLIALARVVAADLRDADGGLVLRTTDAGRTLTKTVQSSAQNLRGFAVLALAIALRDCEGDDRAVVKFREDAREILLEGLARAEGNAERQAPFVVAAGLAGLDETLPQLERMATEANQDQELRAFAAVACRQIGKAMPSTVHALKRAVADYRLGNLRVEAALGLSFLTGDRDAGMLREDIERRRYTHSHQIGHVAIALGQMGDLRAIEPLSDLLLDGKSDHGARGAAAVALGLLCDPEEKPSLSRLWEDVNYPARSAAMHAALNFF